VIERNNSSVFLPMSDYESLLNDFFDIGRDLPWFYKNELLVLIIYCKNGYEWEITFERNYKSPNSIFEKIELVLYIIVLINYYIGIRK